MVCPRTEFWAEVAGPLVCDSAGLAVRPDEVGSAVSSAPAPRMWMCGTETEKKNVTLRRHRIYTT